MQALLIHGAGGGAWEWAVWHRVLAARGIEAAAVELVPGVGRCAGTRLQDYVEQVVVAARGADVLVGASLGGLLALAAAPARPRAALVLVNPLPPTPWAAALPARAAYPDVVPWGRDASLASTRRALPDADAATAQWAWRRWRDESGAVLNAARAGIEGPAPACPVLVLASELDDDVPPTISVALATAYGASCVMLPGASHVGPLLGRGASRAATFAAGWLETQRR